MATEKMNADERFKYLRLMQPRYHQANRQDKTRLLDEMQAVNGLHRKYFIAQMHRSGLHRRKRDRQRTRTYGPEVEQVVAVVADTLDWIGAERMQPNLATTAQHLARFGHLPLSDALLAQLQQISISTLRRMLHRIGRPADAVPQVHRGRRADSVVQAMVPVGIIPCVSNQMIILPEGNSLSPFCLMDQLG